jgi:hypothetical protein
VSAFTQPDSHTIDGGSGSDGVVVGSGTDVGVGVGASVGSGVAVGVGVTGWFGVAVGAGEGVSSARTGVVVAIAKASTDVIATAATHELFCRLWRMARTS